jgi:hypothetical protein
MLGRIIWQDQNAQIICGGKPPAGRRRHQEHYDLYFEKTALLDWTEKEALPEGFMRAQIECEL